MHLGATRKIAEVHKAIEAYVEARDERMAWGLEERAKLEALQAVLKKHKLEKTGYKAEGHEAWIVKETKCRARVSKDEETT